MLIRKITNNVEAYQAAQDVGAVNSILEGATMVEGKSGVVTAIATDDLDENHYLVIQYYYGFEATEEETEEERNGWVIAEFGGENAHIEVAMYVEETMPNIDGVFLTEFDDEEASSGYKM